MVASPMRSWKFTGTVYSPALPYDSGACPLAFGQNGNQIAGTICGRAVGFSL
jgi:hypothetical protein